MRSPTPARSAVRTRTCWKAALTVLPSAARSQRRNSTLALARPAPNPSFGRSSGAGARAATEPAFQSGGRLAAFGRRRARRGTSSDRAPRDLVAQRHFLGGPGPGPRRRAPAFALARVPRRRLPSARPSRPAERSGTGRNQGPRSSPSIRVRYSSLSASAPRVDRGGALFPRAPCPHSPTRRVVQARCLAEV
jgi:hypothetical protein